MVCCASLQSAGQRVAVSCTLLRSTIETTGDVGRKFGSEASGSLADACVRAPHVIFAVGPTAFLLPFAAH